MLLATMSLISVGTAAPAAAGAGKCAQRNMGWGLGQACGHLQDARLSITVNDTRTDGSCVWLSTYDGRRLLTSCGPAWTMVLWPGSDNLYLVRKYGLSLRKNGSVVRVCDGPASPVAGVPACASL